MGYTIRYGPPVRGERAHSTPQIFAAIVLGIMILLVLMNIVGLGDEVFWFLLPGDRAVTAEALDLMEQQIRDGTPFSEAFFAFCESVIQGAEDS